MQEKINYVYEISGSYVQGDGKEKELGKNIIVAPDPVSALAAYLQPIPPGRLGSPEVALRIKCGDRATITDKQRLEDVVEK